ncbi:hypothetical protein PR048_008968 [Dryococelus australis]|uniref:Uncharacterized protein n=1 Tax=Dryococelus australis TaxID=614101 RepID=A0ABQ9HYL9_9NEOP|nr:hypothetical protein PR048_008968 [Dryococelus australis]
MYILKKPSKYRTKILCLTDACDSYLLNAYQTQAIVQLTKFLNCSSRNVTCSNWFMSLEVAKVFNKPEIPQEFLLKKKKPIALSVYGFTKEYILVWYIPKRSKSVVLLSSMHQKIHTDVENDKSESVSFYNATK